MHGHAAGFPPQSGVFVPSVFFNLPVMPCRPAAQSSTVFPPPSGRRNRLICFQLRGASGPLQLGHGDDGVPVNTLIQAGRLVRLPVWRVVQVEHPEENRSLVSLVSLVFPNHSHTHNFHLHVEEQAGPSLKWPIHGVRLEGRWPSSASATLLLLSPVIYPPPRYQHVSQGAAGVSKTSQRWIKPCVKLPL